MSAIHVNSSFYMSYNEVTICSDDLKLLLLGGSSIPRTTQGIKQLVFKHADLQKTAQKGMKELVIDYGEAKQTIKVLRYNTKANKKKNAITS